MVENKMEWNNPETGTIGTYTEIYKIEELTARDGTKVLIKSHYWKDADGELWVDPNNPNENFRTFASEYRKQKGFMQPDEVKSLRNKLGYNVRDFATELGVSYAKLSAIENDKRIQTKYQENLFRKAASDLDKYGHLIKLIPVRDPAVVLNAFLTSVPSGSMMEQSALYVTEDCEKNQNIYDLQVCGGAI